MGHRTETIDAIAIIKNKQYPGLIVFEEDRIVFEINGKRYAVPFDWSTAHCSVSTEKVAGDGILRKKKACYQLSDDSNHSFSFIDDMYDYESSVDWVHELFKNNKKNALENKIRLQREEAAREAERQQIAEAQRIEEEQRELERQEAEARRLEEERLEKERQEAEARRLEEERLEKERQEAEARRLEEERLEKERQEAEARRLEEERLKKERQEAEARRLEEERLEKERQEAEARRLEEERLEKERQEAEARRMEEERLEKERQEAEQRHNDLMLEKERIEEDKRRKEELKKEKYDEEDADRREELIKRGRDAQEEGSSCIEELKRINWNNACWGKVGNMDIAAVFGIDKYLIEDENTNDLVLSGPLRKKLIGAGYKSFTRVLEAKISDLRSIKGFGDRSWQELIDFLVKYSDDESIENQLNVILMTMFDEEEIDSTKERKHKYDKELLKKERLDQERWERINNAWQKEDPEEDLLKQERQEAEARRLEEERLEKERQEAEARRLEEERLEKERQEAEARRIEEERHERERQEEEARRIEEERLEKERQEAIVHNYMKTSNREIQDTYEDNPSEILDKVEEIKSSKDLLDSFFSTSEMTVIHEEIIYSWIKEEKRDSFVNYIALAIRNVPTDKFESSGIKRILDRIIDAASTGVNSINPIFCPSFDRTCFSPSTIKENKEQIFKSLKAICGLLGMKLDKNYEAYCKWIIRSNVDEYFNNKRMEEARQEKERQEAAVHRLEIEHTEQKRQEKERQEAEMRRIEEERLERKREEAAAHPEEALISDLIECIQELEQSVDELVYIFSDDSDIANLIDSIEDYIKDLQKDYIVLEDEWLADRDQKSVENKKVIEDKYAAIFNNWHPYVELFYPLACNESSVRFFLLRSYCKGRTGGIVSRMILSCISQKDYDRAELLFKIVNCSIDNAEDGFFDDRNNEILTSISKMINQYTMEKPEKITLFDYSESDGFLVSQLNSIIDHIEQKGITDEGILKSIKDSELLIQNANNPEYIVREPSEESIDERIENYEEALKADDRELEEKCQENPKYTMELIRCMNKYYVKADCVHRAKESIRTINAHRLDNRAEYFINAYTEDEFLRETLNKYILYPSQTLGHYMSNVIVNHLDVHWSRISEFLGWCCFNITSEVDSFVAELKQDERAYQILKLRAQKNTLEQVGSSLGVTRERVRQIEQRKIRSFVLWRRKNKPLLKIYADRNGDRILTIEEISEYFGEESDLMTYFLKAEDSSSVFFNKKTSTFVIGDEQMAEKAEKYVDSLPDLFDDESLDFYLTNGRYYYGLVQEITEKVILESYNKTGNKFHRSRLRRETIYGDVLRLYFPDGMHVYDDRELGIFRKHVKKEYGLDVNVTNHGLSAGISKVGLLCDKGTYKYNDGNYISENLAKRIENYVDNSKIPIFMTNTLFSVFEDELVSEGITNKYYLQGVLHELFGNKWIFRRDYISKDENITSISTSIVRIIEKSTVPVTKEDILRVFPGLTDVVINLAVNDDSIINLFGSYIHEKRIKLSKGDRDYLRKTVERLLSPSGICHCKDIFEYIDADYHSLLANNYINYSFCMYSLLENIFRESYNFSRPFISKKGVKIDKIRDIINEMVAESAFIDIDEINAFAKEQHFVINGQLDFWDSFNSTHLILNDSQLVSILTTGIDTTKANQVEELILDEISGTIPVSNLHCIKDFPEIKTDWTDWLIYSVLKKWGKNIEVAPSNAQFRQAFPLVAPKGKMNTDEYSGMSKEMIGEIATPDDLSNIEELIGSYILEDV